MLVKYKKINALSRLNITQRQREEGCIGASTGSAFNIRTLIILTICNTLCSSDSKDCGVDALSSWSQFSPGGNAPIQPATSTNLQMAPVKCCSVTVWLLFCERSQQHWISFVLMLKLLEEHNHIWKPFKVLLQGNKTITGLQPDTERRHKSRWGWSVCANLTPAGRLLWALGA